ncbi:DUF559 domain-containing protein [Tessaracoccus sp. G1721]
MRHELQEIINSEAIIRRRLHPALGDAIDRAHKDGDITRVLPGVFAAPEQAEMLEIRTAAIAAVDPNLTFVRHTAARLTWWPELTVEKVQVASTRRRPAPGYDFEARKVPAELRQWNGEVFISSPEHSVLELSDTMGGAVIDEALRREAVTLDSLKKALAAMPARAGNAARARLLHESRDAPWSELERDAHVRLRTARLKGWKTNLEVIIEGEQFFVDVAFPGLRLALEFDGWQYHKDHEAFVHDRRRDVLLTLAGWTVLRFTAATMDDMVECVGQAVRLLSRG